MIKNSLSLADLKLELKLLKTDSILKKSLLPILEKNQVVDAKVLKFISPDKAELLILGKKVVADTPASANFTKGDTIQLKVTEQGQLNILKVIPEKAVSGSIPSSVDPTKLSDNTPLNPAKSSANMPLNPTKSSVNTPLSSTKLSTNTPLSPNQHSNSTINNSLGRISDSALQLLARNQPFEGFTNFAASLFSNSKETSLTQPDKQFVAQTDKQILTQLDKQIIDQPDKQISAQPDKQIIDIKNLLMSIALKSEKADVDFLPKLLQKSGILMEKKLADMVKKGSDSLPKFESVSQTSSYSSSVLTSSGESLKDAVTEPSLNKATQQFLADNSTSKSIIKDDIKGAVLNFIATSGDGSAEVLSLENRELPNINVFKEFIQNLESVQLLNSHLSESGKYIIPFPLLNGEQFSFGQLLIDLGENRKGNENTYSKENSLLKVSLFLDMTNLGPIRADFSVLKNNITGGFQVADEEIANFFKLMLPELKERLQIHDYNVHKIECRVVESEKLAEKSIIKELLKSEGHGFNLMI
ncbi:MAG: flagellar hook-length control protein FliK [Desulfamplus sp.]|nr:flagellar hook-length control protein FliK [Desulfamplus sp.]